MLTQKDLLKLNWSKTHNLIPVVIQNNTSYMVLMHGYMNYEALLKTQKEGLVTFYSRTKKRLWTKGETSGNFLKVIEISTDCDYDSLLILVSPIGNTCHLSKKSCFFSKEYPLIFLFVLEEIIHKRKKIFKKSSYTHDLYISGTTRIAQKVGEEAIEMILAAMKSDKNELINETSDFIYHLIVLLQDQGLNLSMVIDNLKKRHVLSLNNK